jgi:hypothetical protein
MREEFSPIGLLNPSKKTLYLLPHLFYKMGEELLENSSNYRAKSHRLPRPVRSFTAGLISWV